jgi:hypothetical protein
VSGDLVIELNQCNNTMHQKMHNYLKHASTELFSNNIIKLADSSSGGLL